MATWRVTYKNLSNKLNITRPRFCRIAEAYMQITSINENFEKTIKENVENLKKWEQLKLDFQKNIEKYNVKLDKRYIDNFNYIDARYAMVGGEPLLDYINDTTKNKVYRNTCALRVSFAFNYGGMQLKNLKNKIVGRERLGKDAHAYYLSSIDIKNLLIKNWGIIPFNKGATDKFYYSFYDYKNIKDITMLDNLSEFKKIRDKNIEFKEKLLGKQGIVTMDIAGFHDAVGHTTLWDGQKFVDVAYGADDYLASNNKKVIVKEICFWQLS